MKILNENESFHLSYCDLNQISEAYLVVFFVTDNFLSSTSFKKTLKAAKEHLKLIQPVKIGDVEEINLVKQFKFCQGTFGIDIFQFRDDLSIKVLSDYIKETYHLDATLLTKSIGMFLSTLKRVQNPNLLLDSCIISDEEIILRRMNGNLEILNFKTNTLVNTIDLNGGFNSSYCWIIHSQRIFVIDRDACKLFRKNGSFDRTVDLRAHKFVVAAVLYNIFTMETIITSNTAEMLILDKNLCFKRNENLKKSVGTKIKIYGENIYVWETCGALEVYEYETSFKKVANFMPKDFILTIANDIKMPNYLYIQLLNKNVLLFNTNTFSIDGLISNAKFELSFVINENLILNDYNGNLFLYKTDFVDTKKDSDLKLICKVKLFDRHLYSNPYLLPCKTTGCLDCLYNTFNFYTNTYRCMSCGKNHKLDQKLEKDSEFNDFRYQNYKELFREILNYNENKTMSTLNLIF